MLIRKIFLSWRQGHGSRRHIVGVITRNYADGIKFEYFPEVINEALPDGFQTYPEFTDIHKIYTDGVLDIFARRLTQAERSDRFKVLGFWEADNPTYDTFDLLALTQGWLPTDNFEFLGNYHPKPGFKFVTDLARVGSQNISKGVVKFGDVLHCEFERNNAFDNKAVKIYKGELLLGYIKQKHCNYFHKIKKKGIGNISVKAVDLDQNGIIRQIFALVK